MNNDGSCCLKIIDDVVNKLEKIIKENGQLCFVCWQNPSLNPWQSLSIQVIKEFLDLPSPPAKSPGPFAFEDKNYIKEIRICPNQESISSRT